MVIAAAAGLLVALGALLYVVIQRNRTVTLPSPTGHYAVGRILDEWTDQSRLETLGASTGQYRRLTVSAARRSTRPLSPQSLDTRP